MDAKTAPHFSNHLEITSGQGLEIGEPFNCLCLLFENNAFRWKKNGFVVLFNEYIGILAAIVILFPLQNNKGTWNIYFKSSIVNEKKKKLMLNLS